MRKVSRKVVTSFLYLVTNTAFLLLIANINATCCGPGYQPSLPAGVEDLRHYGKKA